MASIEDKVKNIIVEQLGVDEKEVKPEAHFVDDLGADSLDVVELVMALEEEFKLEISDEDAEKLTTVKQAVDYAANQGADWVVLTNGEVWRVYRVTFSKPIDAEMVLEFSFGSINHKSTADLEMLFTVATALFREETMDRLARRCTHVLEPGVAHPDRPLSALAPPALASS